MLNKSAQGAPVKLVSLLGTVFLLFFSIFVIILPTMEEYYVMTKFSIEHLESDILSSRIVDAPECLAYEDGLGRVHPGVIDISKFTEDQIKKCLDLKDGVYVRFEDITGQPIKNSIGKRHDNYINNTFLVRYTEDSGTTFKTGVMEVAL